MATLGSSDADSASLSDEVKGTRPENMPGAVLLVSLEIVECGCLPCFKIYTYLNPTDSCHQELAQH